MDEPDGQSTPAQEGSAGSETSTAGEATNAAGRDLDGSRRGGGGGRVPPGRVGSVPAGNGGGSTPPSLYVLDHLVWSGYIATADEEPLNAVQAAITEAGLPLRAEIPADAARLPALEDLPGVLAELRDELWVTRIVLVPTDPGYAVDAQQVLADIRRVAPDTAARLALDHVLTPSGGLWPGIGGLWPGIGGLWPGIGGLWPGIGTPAEYGIPGRGGRMPVHLAVPKPRPARRWERRPVVALPDTGLGEHPWFDGDPSVQVGASFRGVPIGGANEDLGDGVSDELVGALGALAGHGTFVAGIVRQRCPEAAILSIPVMSRDGIAVETEVHTALVLLLLRHVNGVLDNHPDDVIDVLSVSMGYYPDPSDDPGEEHRFRILFQRYCDWQVIVCAGSGNDATRRPLYPAAFADTEDPDPAHLPVPLLAVGALNPGCRTTALFSNVGSWVRYLRCGAAVVSTVPTTFRGGAQASQVGVGIMAGGRSTIDPEDYGSGFSVWSGTSFSTPAVAADAARGLAADELLAQVDKGSMAARADRARAGLAEVAP